MTLVIVLKCSDGVLFVGDTQETAGNEAGGLVRIPHQLKVHSIADGRFAIGCSGDSSDIDAFVNYLKLQFRRGKKRVAEYAEEEMYERLNQITTTFVAKYRSKCERIYANKTETLPFDFLGIFAAPLNTKSRKSEDQYGLYRITIILTDEGAKTDIIKVKKIGYRTCIGSGGSQADFLLDVVEKFLMKFQIDQRPAKFFRLSSEACAMVGEQVLIRATGKDVASGISFNVFHLSDKRSKFWEKGKDYFDKRGYDELKQIVAQLGDEIPQFKDYVFRTFNIF